MFINCIENQNLANKSSLYTVKFQAAEFLLEFGEIFKEKSGTYRTKIPALNTTEVFPLIS